MSPKEEREQRLRERNRVLNERLALIDKFHKCKYEEIGCSWYWCDTCSIRVTLAHEIANLLAWS